MTTRTRVVLVVALAVLGVASPAVETPAGERDVADPTPIDSCTVISEPGTYGLEDNVTTTNPGVCVEIKADDVTLDGAGNVLEGLRTVGQRGLTTGVSVRNATNVTVRDLVLTDWDAGVSVDNTSNATIADVTTLHTEVGILVSETGDATVTGVAVRDTDSGVVLERVTDAEVTDTVARNFSLVGISLDDVRSVDVSSTTATANFSDVPASFRRNARSVGIRAEDASDVSITGVTVPGNFGGISLFEVTDSNVSDCTVEDNGFGVRLEASDFNRIDDCTVTGNEIGVLVVRSRNLNVSQVTATGNVLGIDLFSSRAVVAADSSVTDSEAAGVVVEDSDDNVFRNVEVEGTSESDAAQVVSANIVLRNATDNRFQNVSVADSESWTVFSTGGGTHVFSNLELEAKTFSFTIRNTAVTFGSPTDGDDVVPVEISDTGPDAIFNVSLSAPEASDSTEAVTTVSGNEPVTTTAGNGTSIPSAPETASARPEFPLS